MFMPGTESSANPIAKARELLAGDGKLFLCRTFRCLISNLPTLSTEFRYRSVDPFPNRDLRSFGAKLVHTLEQRLDVRALQMSIEIRLIGPILVK